MRVDSSDVVCPMDVLFDGFVEDKFSVRLKPQNWRDFKLTLGKPSLKTISNSQRKTKHFYNFTGADPKMNITAITNSNQGRHLAVEREHQLLLTNRNPNQHLSYGENFSSLNVSHKLSPLEKAIKKVLIRLTDYRYCTAVRLATLTVQ